MFALKSATVVFGNTYNNKLPLNRYFSDETSNVSKSSPSLLISAVNRQKYIDRS